MGGKGPELACCGRAGHLDREPTNALRLAVREVRGEDGVRVRDVRRHNALDEVDGYERRRGGGRAGAGGGVRGTVHGPIPDTSQPRPTHAETATQSVSESAQYAVPPGRMLDLAASTYLEMSLRERV